MKKTGLLLLALILLCAVSLKSQVTIGSLDEPHKGAALHLDATDKGLLLPNVFLTNVSDFAPLQVDLENNGQGMVVYNTNPAIIGGAGKGVYVWDGGKWNPLSSESNIGTTANNTIVNDNSSWAGLSYSSCWSELWCNLNTQYIYFESDSIVADCSYKKVFSCNDKLHENSKYEGLIRERDKKTYFIPANFETEYVLYDFSLEKGMTFEYEVFTSQEKMPLYVKNSDFIEINGIPKKRLELELVLSNYNLPFDVWIENLGSTKGFFNPGHGGILPPGEGRALLCYFEDNELIYKNPDYSQCYYDNPEELVSEGEINGSLTWSLENGILTISGKGDMPHHSGLSDIPWYAYRTAINSVVIEPGVTSIGNSSFQSCSNLTSVTIPDGITTIGEQAFFLCGNLSSIVIPNSVTSIGRYAFTGCGLVSVTIPNRVKNIEISTFSSCSKLISVTIPNSVTSIESGVFHSCSNLTSITIPNSVTGIGTGAFYDCIGLSSITIPNSVTNIEENAFSGCISLTWIEVENENNFYSSEDGVLFNKNKTTVIVCPEGKTGTYVIPDGVINIGRAAFNSCINLTSITIPASVTNIESWAFSFCWDLRSITNLNPVPVNISSSVFYPVNIGPNIDCTLMVPTSAVSAYEGAGVWSKFNIVGMD